SWHAKCFSCSLCEGALRNDYFEKNGGIYCTNCYKRSFLSCCKQCGEAIADQVMSAVDFVYHPQCFRCKACSQVIYPGCPYALSGGELYCAVHHRNKYASPASRRKLNSQSLSRSSLSQPPIRKHKGPSFDVLGDLASPSERSSPFDPSELQSILASFSSKPVTFGDKSGPNQAFGLPNQALGLEKPMGFGTDSGKRGMFEKSDMGLLRDADGDLATPNNGPAVVFGTNGEEPELGEQDIFGPDDPMLFGGQAQLGVVAQQSAVLDAFQRNHGQDWQMHQDVSVTDE
ncbi:hypothetical protein SARC_09228, partial [Sphaeroforma arctica JP610]